MLGWFIMATAATLLAILIVGRSLSRRRRRLRRRARRQRHAVHQMLWDRIMLRPRTRRLTFGDRDR